MDRSNIAEKKIEQKKCSSVDLYGRSGGKKIYRWCLFLIALSVFAGIFVFSLIPPSDSEEEGCMGVPVLSAEEYAQYTTYKKRDYSDYLRFKNEFVAVDLSEKVIYIPQKINESTTMEMLDGKLTMDYPGKKIFFAPDDAWDNLAEAVSQGHRFELLVAGHGDTYMKYDVVFTTLPVFSFYGDAAYTDEDKRTVYSGRLVMWDPEEPLAKSSRLTWHVRGGSSSNESKHSWKVSLKDWDGNNNNEEFLGLGSDDDWIFNAMNMEDSNLRDKFGMDLWNNMVLESGNGYPMSRGEYVELLVRGKYCGLYLLQRRVDDKYLELNTDEIVVKSKPYGGVLTYSFFSKLGNSVPEQDLKSYFEEYQMHNVELNNFVDVNLFLQLLSAEDNRFQKNMFYVFKEAENGYTVSLIPWDLDMTMGLIWSEEKKGFLYDYESSLNKSAIRMEYDSMLQRYPNLDQMMCERWKQFRQTFFAQDYLEQLMNQNLDLLNSSGSVSRDQEVWGLYFSGEDTVESLYRFLDDRLALLDELYQ